MERFHELDALRGAAMLLGIVLHAALFLVPDVWPTQDPWLKEVGDDSPYGLIVAAIHGFRMPVFFLLSGFFTAMLWERRGLREMGRHRLKRIGLSLAAGAVTIVPLNMLFFADDFNLLLWPVAWAVYGFNHLWFLWFLLFIVVLFIVAAKAGVSFRHGAWWLVVPLVFAAQLLMGNREFGPDTPSTRLIPELHLIAYYGLFFFFGAFLYARRVAIQPNRRGRSPCCPR